MLSKLNIHVYFVVRREHLTEEDVVKNKVSHFLNTVHSEVFRKLHIFD